MDFSVSVIIPVYNAAPFIRKAAMSAIDQPEVKEVILVEDNSPDESLSICYDLEEEYDVVRVIRHPNGENRGAAASRNRGIESASYRYVALLDADDYYLPNRFKRAREIFSSDGTIDGVYEAMGLHIYSEGGFKRYEDYKGKNLDRRKLVTVNRPVTPAELFEKMVLQDVGIFHANGITVKKDFILGVGMFDEDLDIVEDTVMWFKLAFHGKLAPGNIAEPVAMQGIHDANREPNLDSKLLYKKYHRLFYYFLDKKTNKKVLRTFFLRMLAYDSSRKAFDRHPFLKKTEFAFLALKEALKHPRLLHKLL